MANDKMVGDQMVDPDKYEHPYDEVLQEPAKTHYEALGDEDSDEKDEKDDKPDKEAFDGKDEDEKAPTPKPRRTRKY